MFWGKKLMTTNKEIANYDFYNPNNILILTAETQAEDIKVFLQSPFFPYPKHIVDNYEIKTWIKQFL